MESITAPWVNYGELVVKCCENYLLRAMIYQQFNCICLSASFETMGSLSLA